MSFAITLFSNAPSTPGFDNTYAHFKVRLAEKLTFSEPYEVALDYITFPKTWYNVFDENVLLVGRTNDAWVYAQVVMPRGYYETSKKVVEKLNSLFQENLKPLIGRTITKMPELIWNPFLKSCSFNDAKMIAGKSKVPIELSLSDHLKAIIGYVPHNLKPEEMLKVYCADIHAGFRTLLAYTNIVDYTFVGHTRSQLLELIDIPTSASFGDQIQHRITSPRYIPLISPEVE